MLERNNQKVIDNRKDQNPKQKMINKTKTHAEIQNLMAGPK
jgi:hypothetical protein